MDLSGRTTLYKHKHNDWEDRPVECTDNPGIKKVWMLDAQWSTCPTEVETQVKQLWHLYDNLGNDHSMLKLTIMDLEEIHSKEFPTDLIIEYLRANDVPETEMVIIHWWW